MGYHIVVASEIEGRRTLLHLLVRTTHAHAQFICSTVVLSSLSLANERTFTP
jgi:hypothetical protein